jgi:PPOX class probable F420-dependent enzyme
VWFLWDGKGFLIYAQDGAKVRHIRENPNVELHLNTDEAGDVVVRAAGKASIAKARPTDQRAAYVRKYGRPIRDLGMTPEAFFETYHNPIRVSSVRFR